MKQYSKIIVYPVLYEKDTNGDYVLDTNNEKIVIQNYLNVSPSQDYEVVTETQEYFYLNVTNLGTDIWAATWIATDPTVPNLTIAAESLGNVNYFNYVKPMIQLLDCTMTGSYKLSSASSFVDGTSGCPQRFAAIITKLNQLPEGKRSIGMYRYNNGPIYDEVGDRYPSGNQSPWAANAINTLKQDWLYIANALAENNSTPDYLILDCEQQGTFRFFGALGGNPTRVNEITTDSRLNQKWYNSDSFADLYTNYGEFPLTFTNISNGTFHPQTAFEYSYWDRSMDALHAQVLNEAFYKPTLDIFSNIKVSNYESDNIENNNYVYDSNGHIKRTKYYVGDANSPVMYGSWMSPSVYGIYANDTTKLVRTNYGATIQFDNTAWNQFLILVNNIRSIKRSSPNFPIRPWIASIDFTGDSAYNPKWKTDGTVSSNISEGLYWESIRHFCLTGTQMFNYWNTSDNTPEKIINNCGKLNTVLSDVNDQLGGYSDTVTNINKINFLANYVISGAKIVNSNNYLWRITPKPGVILKDINNTIITTDSDGGVWLTTTTSSIPIFNIA
jgi:hypothetical protein